MIDAATHGEVDREALARLLVHGALPGELEGFGADEAADAAEFVGVALAFREPGKPAIAIDTFRHDGERRQMRVAVVNADTPFLVDSVAGVMANHGLVIDRLLHPIAPIARTAEGRLTDLEPADAPCESIIYMETDRADAAVRQALEAELADVLADVSAAVADWTAMTEAMADDARATPDDEVRALLQWFGERHFTLLGHEHRDRGGVRSDRLGIASGDRAPLLADATFDAAFDWFDEDEGRASLLLKSNHLSTVHRRTPLDLILLPVRRGGRTEAVSLHAGLWTSSALNTQPDHVPVLRQTLARLERRFGFDPAGHTGKALVHAVSSLPHDLLIAFGDEQMEDTALTAMSVTDRPRPKLLLVESALGRHLFAFVWLPRDDLSTSRRQQIGAMLEEAAGGPMLNWTVELTDGQVALIRYTFDRRGSDRVVDMGAADERLRAMVRGWAPAFERELALLGSESEAARVALRFGEAFPQGYRTTYGPEEAAKDARRLSRLEGPDERSVRLYRRPTDHNPRGLRLKLYRLGGSVPLSEVVPALEDFGFTVMGEVPTELGGEADGTIHDFSLESRDAVTTSDLLDRSDEIEGAIEAVLVGTAERDEFNRLVIAAGLSPKQVVLVRAWFRYLRQTGLTYGLITVADVLARSPGVTRAIVGLFAARHDPARAQTSEELERTTRSVLTTGLAAVKAIDDDRVLRRLLAVAEACLRTNAYSLEDGEALAFKLDSALVPGLPAPLPWREVWVYSPRLEGIHLRAGPVARGGIRWSDRRDDFRTEVLGLMKAQRVKNAVIVPTGAKGGFYPKALPDPALDREAWAAEGRAAYQVYIRSLLSITDSLENGVVVHPAGVVRRDGDDPYFVVAADKGTASFSDTANALAEEADYWLGDAFASGGSHGYDHKAMAITARGAWISVQRHFLERGVDVQTQPVTVAGVGDMSGDVFGNGMLLSKTLKLTAAFDHRHIFLDPDPDPATSWAERKRLFELPRSSWNDYDKALISDGGGVWARTDKSVPLSPPVRTLLGTDAEAMEPGELISAILAMEVDLLWFGGIGTYLKAEAENNAAVGDPLNDRLRIDAERVRARVIGEGANLAVTQAARIVFARGGGGINTDFIDNSAGVDCSDNEVNIKIALQRPVKDGELSRDDRNALLAEMTEEVAEVVLEDNRLQTLALSVASARSREAAGSFVRLIDRFEADGALDRRVEGLAANDELLRRAGEREGLTRPELAVLLSTAKLVLQDAIEATALADDPAMDEELLNAFPATLAARFPDALLHHQLRTEIVATEVANRIVNRMGIVHPFELAEEEGASMGEVATAYLTVERLLGVRAIWEALDVTPVPEDVRLALFDRAAASVRAHTADLLRSAHRDGTVGGVVDRLAERVRRLTTAASDLVSDAAGAEAADIERQATAGGAAPDLAADLKRLYAADGAIGLASLAERSGTDELALARAFTRLGEVIGLDWAQTTAQRVRTSDPWERLLLAGLARDLQQMRLDFLRDVACSGGDAEHAVEDWLAALAPRVRQFREHIDSARAAATVTPAMLAQLTSQARVLLSRAG